ncbi:hypothetical protein [Flavihumibacter sp. CACIAM 22H1]|uniref:hypothetical protein n=1 Tax=Flavihumibacter sp. CACIAM 22H1 TaxID=1812911 RepID=UPI0007A83C99|nr:hypothetical protein [Flavihumibacter sp. CACIAM 22H1]KYP13958.1 MAG: hypothetical protein A1D16_01010 [Flavihumibacter sp. CACIAM 22H1]
MKRAADTWHFPLSGGVLNTVVFKWLPFITCCLMVSSASGQRTDWRNRIDELVARADSLSLVSQQTFYLNKFLSNDRPIRETWHYTVSSGRVVIFEVHYFVDSVEYLEVYYLDRDQVICSEQYEIEYPHASDDRIRWGTVRFFQGNTVQQSVSMGTVPEQVEAGRSYDSWIRFKSRFRELAAQRTLQEKNYKEAIFAP